MRLLLHVCCGPCATGAVESVRDEFPRTETVGFFYNPNIHPEAEYERRRTSVKKAAQVLELPLLFAGEEEGLVDYLRQIAFRETDRCRVCYAMRLSKAAQYAVANNFDAFSTTLLISPYQDQEALRLVGEALGRLFGPDFIFHDMRPFYRRSRQHAREMGLYMQNYCGCIFSELERLHSKLQRKRANHPKTTAVNTNVVEDFGFTFLENSNRRVLLPMSSARPFTLAGLDPEATAQLLDSVTHAPLRP